MKKINKYLENARHHLNGPLPNRKAAIHFYEKAIESTNDIAEKAVIANEINKLKEELNIKLT